MPASDRDLDDIALMQDAAYEAGRLAASFFARSDLASWKKLADEPVTEADLAVNELLRRKLLKARPDYGWLSEESALADHRRDQTRIWLVDPIDGTRAFVKGKPHWCIGISVVEHGKPVSGLVHAPTLDETYWAARGGGAFVNGARIQVSDKAEIENCVMVSNPQMFSHPDWPEPWPQMEHASPKPNATLLRLCGVAAGKYDAALTLVRKSDWDLAPASLMVEEAGGLATTHLAETFQFNRTVPAQRSLLAAGKPLHSLLHARVKMVRLPDPNRPDEMVEEANDG